MLLFLRAGDGVWERIPDRDAVMFQERPRETSEEG